MRKILYSISISLAFLLPFKTIAQAPAFNLSFTNCFGGSESEEFFSANRCLDGGYLLSGLTNSSDGDIDVACAYDTSDIFIVKCDASGNKVWAKTFGGNDYDKARYGIQDLDSNYVITGGVHSDDGDIDSSHGLTELFILKLDQNGDKLWMKVYGGTGYDAGRFINQTADGGYLIAGYSTSDDFDLNIHRGNHDGWMLKVDINGNLEWSVTYGGTDEDRPRSYVKASDGGYVFAGFSNSFDMDCIGANGLEDFWVSKIDSAGNLLWSKLFGGSGDEEAIHISATSDSNFLISGMSASADGDVTGAHGQTDGWIIKVDNSGNLIWQKTLGGTGKDRLYRAFELPDGGIIAVGSSGSADGDLAGTSCGGADDYWVVRLDAGYNFQWSYCLGGTNADICGDIVMSASDTSFFLAGQARSADEDINCNMGNYDFWIAKLDMITSLNEIQTNNDITTLYDAETHSIIINSKSNISAEINIIDFSGRKIFSEKNYRLEAGDNILKLGLPANGLYISSIITSSGNYTLKFLQGLK